MKISRKRLVEPALKGLGIFPDQVDRAIASAFSDPPSADCSQSIFPI
jgi:hypothetical protein